MIARESGESAAHRLLDLLREHGLHAVFGLPGGTVMPVYDALVDRPDLEVVSSRHETAAMFAALGYARVTGQIPLVLVTSGPGFTNALTGLAAAACEGVPILLVAGEIATANGGRFMLQDGGPGALDVLSLARPLTRFAARVERADAIESLVFEALSVARGEAPGPVFLSLPLDVARASVERRRSGARALVPRSGVTDLEACALAASMLGAAESPTIVLGSGARGEAVGPLVGRIAEATGAFVTATAHAKGSFPETHPRYLGVLGFGGHARASAALAASDLTIVVGSRLGDITTNAWSIELGERVVQIDRAPGVIGRNCEVEVAIVGDAATSLAAIASRLPARTTHVPERTSPRECARALGGALQPEALLSTFASIVPRTTIFTADIGEHAAFAIHHLEIDRPDRFHFLAGLGSMGSGIGAAIGIKLARRDTPVVAICGDGGLAMHAGELLTCVEHGLDVVFLVFNDGRYRMVDAALAHMFGRRSPGLPSSVADLAGLARSLGGEGLTVASEEELDRDRILSLMGRGKPLVIDARIDPTTFLSQETRLASLAHFSEGGRR